MQKATFQRKYMLMLQDLEGYKIEIFSWSASANETVGKVHIFQNIAKIDL